MFVSSLWFLVQGYRFAFPPLFETLESAYGVTSAETGLLFTVFLVGYAVMQFPGGGLADRFGEFRIVVAGGLAAAIAALAVAVAPSFALIVVAGGAIGLSTGGHKTVAIKYLSRLYPSHRGRALGAFDTIGISGGVVAPILVSATFVLAITWRSVFLVLGTAGLAVTAVFMRMGDSEPVLDRPTSSATEKVSLRSHSAAFTDVRLMLFSIVSILFTFFYNGVVTFLPTYFTQTKELSPEIGTLLYGVLFVGAAAQIATGELGDRIGRAATAAMLLGSSMVGMAIFLMVESLVGLIAATLFLGLGIHGFRPVRDAYLTSVTRAKSRGGTIGLVRLGMTSVGAAAPVSVGVFISRSGHTDAFLALSMLLGVVIAVAILVVAFDRGHTRSQ